MSIISRIRNLFGNTNRTHHEKSTKLSTTTAISSDSSHFAIIQYVDRVASGNDRDEAFESQLLADLDFESLNLAETIFFIARKHGIPDERVCHFFDVVIEGKPDKFALLLRRVYMLSSKFGEKDRQWMLKYGFVGDASDYVPLKPEINNVGIVVNTCLCVLALADQRGHDAHDLSSEQIKQDAGWD